jgi:hypothetical protein
VHASNREPTSRHRFGTATRASGCVIQSRHRAQRNRVCFESQSIAALRPGAAKAPDEDLAIALHWWTSSDQPSPNAIAATIRCMLQRCNDSSAVSALIIAVLVSHLHFQSCRALVMWRSNVDITNLVNCLTDLVSYATFEMKRKVFAEGLMK